MSLFHNGQTLKDRRCFCYVKHFTYHKKRSLSQKYKRPRQKLVSISSIDSINKLIFSYFAFNYLATERTANSCLNQLIIGYFLFVAQLLIWLFPFVQMQILLWLLPHLSIYLELFHCLLHILLLS